MKLPDTINSYDIQLKKAEEHIRAKHYKDALDICNEIINTADSPLSKAAAYITISDIYYIKFDIANYLKYGKIGIGLLGEKIPDSSIGLISNLVIELLYHIVRHLLRIKSRITEKAESIRLINRFYSHYNVKVISADAEILRSNIRQINLNEKNAGESNELCYSYSMLGLLCAGFDLKRLAFYYINKAVDMAKRIGDSGAISESLMHQIVLNQGSAQSCQNSLLFEEFLFHCKSSRDSYKIINSYSGLTMHYYYFSEYEKSEAAYLEGLSFVSNPAEKVILGLWGYPFSLIESGRFDETLRFLEEQKCFLKGYKNPVIQINIPFQTGYLYLEKKEYDKALANLKEAESYFSKVKFIPVLLHYIFIYTAEALIGKYSSENMDVSTQLNIQKEISRYCKISVKRTTRHSFAAADRGGALRVYAEYQSLCGHTINANRYFIKSIEANIKTGRPFEEAKTRYRYGLHLKKNGDFDVARRELAVAYGIFSRINVNHYASLIISEYGFDEQFRARVMPATPAVYRERLQTLMNLIHRVSYLKNDAEIMELVKQSVRDATGSANVLITDFRHSRDLPVRIDKTTHAEFQRALDQAAATGTAVISEDPSFKGGSSILVVPVRTGNTVTGVCCLDRPLFQGAFTLELAETVSSILNVASMALYNLSRNGVEGKTPSSATGRAARVPQAAVSKLELVKNHINSHYQEPGLRTALAQLAKMTPDHLGKLFKSYESMTISDYINNLRITEARKRIETTDERIINIAFSVGFENLSTFNRLFLKLTGYKPSQIRKPQN
jgi:AraC-like DNA-binding protein/tetratricopeptide (TPR) repeat protein